MPESAIMLQIENFDQTTTGALAQWDDHQSLADYDYSSDSMEAPENDDEKRKLAYRSGTLLLHSLHCPVGANCLLGMSSFVN